MVPLLAPPHSILATVNEVVENSLDHLHNYAVASSSHAETLFVPIRSFARAGKRTRAIATCWGYQLACGLAAQSADGHGGLGNGGSRSAAGIYQVAASVELFHAAALIHDDIIDDAQTRRGFPSTHAHFQDKHRAQEMAGQAKLFGTGAAIIAGDLCLGLSEKLYASSGLELLYSAPALAAHNALRTDVMIGQYLDIWLQADSATAAEMTDRAMEVLTLKSAKYSVEQPFILGATLGGGSQELIEALSAFGLPLGQAFQLRDDYLGVFGDPRITGKPAGDDLREGKKTVLVAYTLQRLAEANRTTDANWLASHLGRSDLGVADIERMQTLMVDSGALDAFEKLITTKLHSAQTALEALRSHGVNATDIEQLQAYADALTQRNK